MAGDYHDILLKVDRLCEETDQEIRDFKNKEPQDIDFSSYYEDLKEIFQWVAENNCFLLRNQKFQQLFLILAIEIFNSERYYSSFWNTVFVELKTENRFYNYAFNALLSILTHLQVKIVKGQSNQNLVVYTLKTRSLRDSQYWELVFEFFKDYFKFHRGESCGDYFKLYSHNIHYGPFIDEPDDVINYVDTATSLFSDLIEDHNENLDDEKYIRSYLKEGDLPLGAFRHRKITSIIRDLSNRMTPMEFKKLLKRQMNSDVITPENKQYPIRQLINSQFDYGNYFIESCKFQITPNHRIGINEMFRWEYNKVVDYKGISYYKKSDSFEVMFQDVRRCILESNSFFVWCGVLPIGKGVIIDGTLQRREGFSWDPKLKMSYGLVDNPPTITVDTGNVIFYGKTDIGKRLSVLIGNKVIGEDVTSIDGFSSHAYIYTIQPNENNFQVRAQLNEVIKGERKVVLENHVLFSNSSREQIRSQHDDSHTVLKHYGESSYTLFSKYSPEIIKTHIQMKSCQIIGYEETFLDYYIYEINWIGEEEFEFRIDNYIWKFQIKKEIYLFFNNSNNVFFDFRQFDIIIDVSTFSGQDNLTYQIFNSNYQAISDPVVLEELSFINGIYHLTGKEIIENSLGFVLYPGEYIIEIAYGDLSLRRPFYLIPKIDCQWPLSLPENELVPIEFHSSDKIFFDTTTENATDIFHTKIGSKVQDIDIGNTISIIQEKKSMNIPLISPRITYSVEIPDIPIFGFRLFEIAVPRKENFSNEIPINDLTYYTLENSSLLIFSKPEDTVALFRNHKKIMDFKIPPDNNILIESLLSLQSFCNDYINEFFLQSEDGYIKRFKIYWNPKIIEIESQLKWEKGLVLHFKVTFNGPINSKITIKISSDVEKIEEITKTCSGHSEVYEGNFFLNDFLETHYIFLQTYCHSFNNEWVPSRNLVIFNNFRKNIIVQTGKNFEKSVRLYTKKFFEELHSDGQLLKLLQYPHPIRISFYDNETVWNNFVSLFVLLTQNSKNIRIIIPEKSHLLDKINQLKETTPNPEQIYLIDLKNQDLGLIIDSLSNPYRIPDVFGSGLGINSIDEINQIKHVLPTYEQIVIFDEQCFSSVLIKDVIKNKRNIHLILINRSVF